MKRTPAQLAAYAARVSAAAGRAIVRARRLNGRLEEWLKWEAEGRGAVRFDGGVPRFAAGERPEYVS